MTDKLIDRLAADLGTSDFTVGTLSELWGERAEQALHRGERIPALRALAARSTVPDAGKASSDRGENTSDAAATLASVFLLGVPVPASVLADALPTLGLSGAVELGLVSLETEDGIAVDIDAGAAGEDRQPAHAHARARALVDLRPYSFVDLGGAGSWWIVSDLGEMVTGGALTTDHVLGVGGASLTLSGLMMSGPVERALDLGTGCGIQALHAARHAEHVVATDISPRALEIATLNARLNGVTNIEFRLGDMFEPVAGERFDQIVTNPPFVITPRRDDVPAYEYRDGGRVGDGIMREVVTGVGAHLTPGGVAQMLGNWEYRVGHDGMQRVRDWADASDTPLDVWLIERERQDPAAYAETWIRDGGTRPGSDEFDRLYAAWLDDFEERGVDAVGFGYLTLRRAPGVEGAAGTTDRARGTGAGDIAGTAVGTVAAGTTDPAGSAGAPTPLRRFERLPDALAGSAGLGTHIELVLGAHDWLAAHDDDALWRATLQVAPDVTEERNYWPGNDDPSTITLKQGGGFSRSIRMDTSLAALVGACDGELPVGVIVEAIAQLLDAEAPELRRELLPRVRDLVLDGFLLTDR